MKMFFLFFALLFNQLNAQDFNKEGPEVQDAQFAGGQKELASFLAEHLRYPEKSAVRHTEGTVSVAFTVGSDGTVRNAKIRNGLNRECDKEALRLVLSMPKWEPATINDRNIACGKTVQVDFRMAY